MTKEEFDLLSFEEKRLVVESAAVKASKEKYEKADMERYERKHSHKTGNHSLDSFQE